MRNLITGHSCLQGRVHPSLHACSCHLTLRFPSLEHSLEPHYCVEALGHSKLCTTELKIQQGKEKLSTSKCARQNVVKCHTEVLTRLMASASQLSSELSFIYLIKILNA